MPFSYEKEGRPDESNLKSKISDKESLIRHIKNELKTGKQIPLGVPYDQEIVDSLSAALNGGVPLDYPESDDPLKPSSLSPGLKMRTEIPKMDDNNYELYKCFMFLEKSTTQIKIKSFYTEVPSHITADIVEKKYLTLQDPSYSLVFESAYEYKQFLKNKNTSILSNNISIESAKLLLEEIAEKTFVNDPKDVENWLNE